MIDRSIEVERMEHVISVFGSFDQNLRIIETELGVKVLDRDDKIHICGEAEDVMLAEKTINTLLTLAAKGEQIDGEILQSRVSVLEKDGFCYTTLRAHCLENIAQTAEIDQP